MNEEVRKPTAEEIENYIHSADAELGPECVEGWVEWCRQALRKSIGDRVAGRFTEEGFKAWSEAFYNRDPMTWNRLSNARRAAEYAATLETDPMSVEDIVAHIRQEIKAYGWGSIESANAGRLIATDDELVTVLAKIMKPLTVRQSAPVESSECPNCKAHLDLKVRCDVCGVSFDCHAPVPVEGGLTIGRLLKILNDADSEEEAANAIFSRIQSDRAALEVKYQAMVSKWSQALVEHQEDRSKRQKEFNQAALSQEKYWADRVAEIKVERDEIQAELDTLKANSIVVPKVEKWPNLAYCAVLIFRDSYGGWLKDVDILPRPIPETREMTPEEMVDAWKIWRVKDVLPVEIDIADAHDELFDHLLSGKSIKQLMDEANLPTTKIDS